MVAAHSSSLTARIAAANLAIYSGCAAWGQGFAQEALHAVLDYAFGPLHLHRVETDIDPRNTASVRVVTRLGFRQEGLLRERWIVDGETSDSLMMGLLAHEWRGDRHAT